MKEKLVSNCEREFIIKSISEDRRLDGRKLTEYRPLEIQFGAEYGCCQVSMGDTRILAQVSCEIQQPKATRPNEGMLHINVGLSPMGAPHFETGRQSDTSIQLNRLLEKCIKDSKCVDLESLCIVAEEKVWTIRCDLNILNHEGNLVDCASVAALAAICHFRRPDVELEGENLNILDASVRDFIPLSIRHYPVCVSFAIFNEGKRMAVDPSELEERVAEAQLTLGVNAYRELCGVYLVGSTPNGPEVVRKCGNKAASRSVEVVAQIKQAIAKDNEARLAGKRVGFVESIKQGRITSLGLPSIRLPPRHAPPVPVKDEVETMETEEEQIAVIEVAGKGSVQMGEPAVLVCPMDSSSSSSSSSEEESDVEVVAELTAEEKKAKKIEE
ncbi:hypothetical protein B566_EDAN009528, partial [Ephemera danica]